MIGWQWHQLDHMQIICTSLQTDNHASTSSLSFYKPDALPPPNQQCQSTEDKLKILIYHPKFPLKVIHAFPQAIQTTTTAPLPTASVSDSVTIANNARLKLQKFDNHYHKLTGILNLCHDFVTYRNKQVFIRRFNMNRTTEETA